MDSKLKKIKSYWNDPDMAEAYVSVLDQRLQRMNLSGGPLLDLGCGKGYSSCVYALNEAERVYGLDIRLERLKESEKYFQKIPELREKVTFLQGTSDQIPFRSNSLEAVVMNEALSHYTYPDASLRESYRVLRPGGKLYVFDDNNKLDIRGYFRRRLKRWPPFRDEFDSMREEFLRQNFPDLPGEKIERLVQNTRGMIFDDLETMNRSELLEIDDNREYSAPRHPELGAYAEREINPITLKKNLESLGFDVQLLPPAFSVTSGLHKFIDNLISWTHPASLLFSPGFSVLAEKTTRK